MTYVSQHITARGSIRNLPYQSLFFGVLTFSDNPSEHLHRLGLEGAMECLNTTSFSAAGSEYFAKYQEKMTYKNTLSVILREPAVMFRSMKYVLDNMQKVNLDYLGKYASDDPRNGVKDSRTVWLNLWGFVKSKFFPAGYALMFVLTAFFVWFMRSLKQPGPYQDLAIVGLLSAGACIADMIVAILGDGKQELIKHLFFSNLLFDVAAIAFLSSVLIFCYELAEKKLSGSFFHKFYAA
jgi:hypothetical protein